MYRNGDANKGKTSLPVFSSIVSKLAKRTRQRSGFWEGGRSDEDLLKAHRELAPEDLAALKSYALAPLGLRRSFGAWAQDADDLDKFLVELRALRKLPHRGMSFVVDTDTCSAHIKGHPLVTNRFISTGVGCSCRLSPWESFVQDPANELLPSAASVAAARAPIDPANG